MSRWMSAQFTIQEEIRDDNEGEFEEAMGALHTLLNMWYDACRLDIRIDPKEEDQK